MPCTSQRRSHPSLVLTGDRRRGQYRVKLRDRSVSLTTAQLRTLCKLICGPIRTQLGFVPASPVTICRLRHRINESLGREGLGDWLIETGTGTEYRLVIPTSDIARDLSFCELPPGVIAQADMDIILRYCPPLRSVYRRVKSSCNCYRAGAVGSMLDNVRELS